MYGVQVLSFTSCFVESLPFGQVTFLSTWILSKSNKSGIIVDICMYMTSTETEEGIARAIVRGEIDFSRDPWPKVSQEAKDLVKSMLDQNPYNRLTVQEVLGKYHLHL